MTFEEYFIEDNRLSALKSFTSQRVKPTGDNTRYIYPSQWEIGTIYCSYNDLVRALGKPLTNDISLTYRSFLQCSWNIVDDQNIGANIIGITSANNTSPDDKQRWNVKVLDSSILKDNDKVEHLIKALENTVDGYFE